MGRVPGTRRDEGRSLADYLGWLVQKELNRAQRTEARRTTRRQASFTEEPVDQSWAPPWEL